MVCLPIEDQQWVKDMLFIVAMVEGTFLLPVGGIVGRVEVQKNALGNATVLGSLADVELHECPSYAVARAGCERILKPRDRRLAGEIGSCFWQSAADQFEQRIGA